jgi:hypothetical protein
MKHLTLPSNMSSLLTTHAKSLVVGAFVFVLLAKGVQRATRRRSTRLRGPPSTNIFFGCIRELIDCLDPGVYHDKWIQEYGTVYEIPTALGGIDIEIGDPKAVAAFCAKDTVVYNQLELNRVFVTEFVSLCNSFTAVMQHLIN